MQLLRKAGRRLQLTPQAEVLVAAAGEVLDALERAQARLRRPCRRCRVACGSPCSSRRPSP